MLLSCVIRAQKRMPCFSTLRRKRLHSLTDLLTQDDVSMALLLEIDNLEDMMWINKIK
jgi:hypothetical protein